MRRLTNAVEDTAKCSQIESLDTATVATPTSSSTATVTTPNPTGSRAENEPQAASENPFVHGDASSGVDESKSSDEPPTQTKASPEQKVPSPAITKWHRELCSLAEMGFENSARNITLLEKHVVAPGNPGMER